MCTVVYKVMYRHIHVQRLVHTYVHIPVLPQRTQSNMQTLIIPEPGINQNYYTFTLMLLIKFVLCSKLPATKFMNHK